MHKSTFYVFTIAMPLEFPSTHSNLRLYLQPITVVIPNLFGTRDQFGGRQLFHGLGVRGWFVEIQAHYIYYITFTAQFMSVIIIMSAPPPLPPIRSSDIRS